MNIKKLMLGFAMLLPAACFAQGYQMKIVEIPEESGFSGEYDAATDTWTLTCQKNDQADNQPSVRLNAIEAPVPAEYTALCFEYKSTDNVSPITLVMYKVFTGKMTRTATFEDAMPASDGWRTCRVDVTKERLSAVCRFLNNKDQYQDIQFTGLPVGGKISLRNIRYDVNRYAFKDMSLSATSPVLVEAEDFDASVDGTGSYAFAQDQLPAANTTYRNPAGNNFPIYAWGSVDFEGSKGAEAPQFLKKQMKELWDCGFTVTMGTAWPGVDKAFFYDDREVNGVYVALHEDTDLKMIVKAGIGTYGDVASLATEYKDNDRLAGYHILDEPHHQHFPEMAQKIGWIREFDPNHMTYGNLLNINTDMSAIGFKNYDEYVRTYLKEVGPGFLSYDYYPVRQYDNSDEIYIEPNFFENLEIVSKLCKYYGTSFWAFAHSVASECFTPGVHYPVPEEDHMRVQVFGNLAYGAQGIQYFTYKCPTPYGGYNYHDAPISLDNEKTPVWYMVQRINKDVKALTWVFLGAEFLRAGHTNAVTPQGCARLTRDMLPEGVTDVTADGQGVCVSMLKNGRNLFMMVLNADIHNTQKVTVKTSQKLKRVLMDGSKQDENAGTASYDLTPGHFLLYLVRENEPETVAPERPVYERADYRQDAQQVFVGANSAASNGYCVQAMGNPSWNTYAGVIPADGNRTITREQALDNWGSQLSYTLTVPEDMLVDITVGHSVPWSEYGRVAAVGAEPGYQYQIEGAPALNWPKEYAASMILSIDGQNVKPLQTKRPVAPDQFAEDGAEFETILADPSRWTSTAEADGSVSDVLWFWPESGSDNGLTPKFNDSPDYRAVKLSAGTHVVTVTSLCYPWNFDSLRFAPAAESAINAVEADEAADSRIFNLVGVECHQPLAPGIYVQAGRKFVVR